MLNLMATLARQASALRPGLGLLLSSGYGDTVGTALAEAPWPFLKKPYSAEELASAGALAATEPA